MKKTEQERVYKTLEERIEQLERDMSSLRCTMIPLHFKNPNPMKEYPHVKIEKKEHPNTENTQ